MRKDLRILALAPIFVGLGTAGTHAAFDRRSVVFVECTSRDGTETKKGSGVIVTNRGDVLTAQHVVRAEKRVDGKIIWYECKGVRGTGAETPTRRLVRGRKSGQYDAILLRFVDPRPGETFDPVSYVPLTPDLQGKAITAYGVPEGGTGQIEARTGSISATVPKSDGTITTTALTVEGMSGGPVILDSKGALIGIVAGANFSTSTGNYTGFAVLAAQEIADELGLTESTEEGATLLTDGNNTEKPRQSVLPEMVLIEGGQFIMGSRRREAGREDAELPPHRVTIAEFKVSKTEITQNQWWHCAEDAFCDKTKVKDKGGDLPVTNISFNDIEDYLSWLNTKIETGKNYRLLTEAEWEYAARAGSDKPYSWGDAKPVCKGNVPNGANFDGCAKMQILPVASFRPNKWGLHDMHGNVWEWVQDCWHDTYENARGDQKAWEENCHGNLRVLRGGSWQSDHVELRSAHRLPVPPDYKTKIFGFRVARSR